MLSKDFFLGIKEAGTST